MFSAMLHLLQTSSRDVCKRRAGRFPRFYLAVAARRRYAPGLSFFARHFATGRGLPVSAPNAAPLPEGSKAKLTVVKGLRAGKSYSLKQGVTYVGRKGPHPVDVDLTEQENPGVAVAVNRF